MTNNSNNFNNPLAIDEGGTNATAKTAAFDNLAPTTTKGDLIVHNGSDHIRVAAGTDGYVLQGDSGAASGVSWAASSASTAGWVLLSTATASTSSTLDFTSSIDSTYAQYAFVIENLTWSTNCNLQIRTSTDGGSTWDSGASDYQYNTLNRATAQYSPGAAFIQASGAVSTAGNWGWNGIAYLFRPSDSSVVTVLGGDLSYAQQGISAYPAQFTGYRDSAADVDGVRFYPSAGTFGSGYIRMYGISNS